MNSLLYCKYEGSYKGDTLGKSLKRNSRDITDNESSEQFLHGAVSQEWLRYLIGSKTILILEELTYSI